MRYTRWGVFAALLAGAAVLAALVGTTGGKAAPTAKKKVVIGWAYDSSGQMAPFDNPALAAAKIEAAHINGLKKGTVTFQIKTCDTQNNNPTKAKSCALELLDGGANIIFTTCDVDFATPVVQEAIKRGKLAVSTCIGTDQMGPKRFGTLGKLAFSFGNVAQDEGSAMAQYAWSKRLEDRRPRNEHAARLLQERRHGVREALQAARRQDRRQGELCDRPEQRRDRGRPAELAQGGGVRDSTAFNELPAFVSGLRALHNTTPILNSWAGDGTYWVTNSPKVTKYYPVTYASVFGDDPSKDIRRLISSMKAAGAAPGTGGFLGGAQTIDGLYIAINRAHGSLKGAALANQLVKFHNVKVLGGKISFSPKLHTVHGRQYRVIQINNNKAKRVGLVTAKVIPSLR